MENNANQEDIKSRLDKQDELLEKIHSSVEKTRQYFLWTLVISLIVIILPVIGLIIVIPRVISVYTEALGGL